MLWYQYLFHNLVMYIFKGIPFYKPYWPSWDSFLHQTEILYGNFNVVKEVMNK